MRVVALIELFKQVWSNVLVHRKHGDFIVASHDSLEFGVTNDFALVLWVLQSKHNMNVVSHDTGKRHNSS